MCFFSHQEKLQSVLEKILLPESFMNCVLESEELRDTFETYIITLLTELRIMEQNRGHGITCRVRSISKLRESDIYLLRISAVCATECGRSKSKT